jgi:cobyrinic acid a,c-diamide synthase
MSPRLTLGYREAVGRGLLGGLRVHGHEFHRTVTLPAAGGADLDAAFEVDGVPSGFAAGRLVASYLHLHWTGCPEVPLALLRAAQRVPA